MPLLSLAERQSFETLENCLLALNRHVDLERYAVVLHRTKKSKLKTRRKAWIICDRGRKATPRDEERRHSSSRRVECSFSCIVIFVNDVAWHLKVVKPKHNHEASLSEAHPAHRRIAMKKHKEKIARQLTIQIKPINVLSSLRIETPTPNSIRWNEDEDLEIVNSMFINRDIYNLRAQLRCDALRSLTSIQTLIQEFDKSDWAYEMQINDENQIVNLFFSKCITQTLLKANPKILVMNCIYKINRFKMPLLIIEEQIALHTIFYIVFCFMNEKKTEFYIWAMNRLKALYTQLELSSSSTAIIDMKRGLMTAIKLIFLNTSHLLCIWHINKNVLANCKRSFSAVDWNVFYDRWKSLINADFEATFEKMWEQFQITYNSINADLVKYLNATYISFRQRFVKCWTNKVRHFETTTTSRGESEHAVLKKQLSTFNENLKTVVDDIILLLINELHNHLIVINSIKNRYSIDLRKSIFQRLASRVTLFAIRKMLRQYLLLIEYSTIIKACTNTFTIVIDLPCSHRIQKRLYGEKGVLLLKNVHSHWRFDHC